LIFEKSFAQQYFQTILGLSSILKPEEPNFFTNQYQKVNYPLGSEFCSAIPLSNLLHEQRYENLDKI
jgi:hypothetical protein